MLPELSVHMAEPCRTRRRLAGLWPARARFALVGALACSRNGGPLETPHPALAARTPPAESPNLAAVKVLAVNDLHGQLTGGSFVEQRPVGGAAVLAAYLREESALAPDATLIVHAGDLVGASPPSSGLLQDEPAVMLFNELVGPRCSYEEPLDPGCNAAGTLGNHELDEGKDEFLRLVRGGNHERGPFLESPYRGARFPYVSANVIDRATGRPLLPPHVVKQVAGVSIGLVGAVFRQVPQAVNPAGIAELAFFDEAVAINRQVRVLESQGVHAIGVLLHEGGRQEPFLGPTRTSSKVEGPIVDIVRRLDEAVDFVISGHHHDFVNAWLPTASGKAVLVTQALSHGGAYARLELAIDRRTGDIVEQSAGIVPTFADAAPGTEPDPAVSRLVQAAERLVAPLTERVVVHAAAPVLRAENPAGESALGNLIADAQRAALGTDVALTNPGGIRADLPAGTVTYGALFTVQPFGNALVGVELTGQELIDLLNQQWPTSGSPRLLKTSGLRYVWDPAVPAGENRIVAAWVGGSPLERQRRYTVAVNSYLAAGGDGFEALSRAPRKARAPSDLEALRRYLQARPGGVLARIEGRITLANGKLDP